MHNKRHVSTGNRTFRGHFPNLVIAMPIVKLIDQPIIVHIACILLVVVLLPLF